MSSTCRRALFLFAMVAAISAIVAPGAGAAEPTGKYIVVFKDSVEHPGNLAHAQVDQRDGNMNAYFRTAFEGYAATLPRDQIDQLRHDQHVKYITVDHPLVTSAQIIPLGIQRSFASANKKLSIDNVDNLRADVDVAVIDTGIGEHFDLNLAGRTDCSGSGACVDNSGTDENSHGTHVAGTIGAIDNGSGVVGMAPGARLWSVKILNSEGKGDESLAVKGVEWVTAHASTIEVANMSLGCSEACSSPALDAAINASVNAGVVYVVAAGNSHKNVSEFGFAANPNVITVSALADGDGIPGGKAVACSSFGGDDVSASFSNYGTAVDVAAPGTCILSTYPGNKEIMYDGTSMAAPHVTGAAAVLAIQKNPGSKADVEAIRNTITAAGNFEWTDKSPDGVKEPLLDVSNETKFRLDRPLPKNTALPVVSPLTSLQGVPESTTTGTWTTDTWINSPSFTYQWQRCNAAGAECVNIAGATKSTYTPVEADVAKALNVKVTATNEGGSTSAVSSATEAVVPVGQLTEYAGSNLGRIAPGPGGNLWFANTGTISKMTPAGVVTNYSTPSKESQIAGLVTGPDANIWFAEYRGSLGSSPAHIGKITSSGVITEYALPNGSEPQALVVGPDGNIWYTAIRSSKIGKITTAGVITEYALPTAMEPNSITVGPDGNLWFTEYCGGSLGCHGKIGKITTAGAITEYPLPHTVQVGPSGIAAGPDGNLWFTENLINGIGKMTTSGTLLANYPLPAGSGPVGIAKGPDLNLWFTNAGSSKIGRITTAGVVSEYPVLAKSGPQGIAVGAGNYLWFASYFGGKIGKIAP